MIFDRISLLTRLVEKHIRLSTIFCFSQQNYKIFKFRRFGIILIDLNRLSNQPRIYVKLKMTILLQDPIWPASSFHSFVWKSSPSIGVSLISN